MFNADELRLIRAMCITAMGFKSPDEYYEPWKSVYSKATEQLETLEES